jgi:RHS repeat-associated protein
MHPALNRRVGRVIFAPESLLELSFRCVLAERFCSFGRTNFARVWALSAAPVMAVRSGRAKESGRRDWAYDSATHGVGLPAASCVSTAANPGCTGTVVNRRDFTYDTLSRPATSALTVHGTAYTYTLGYDANTGGPGSVAYPSGLTVQYIYGVNGYLTQVKDAASGTALYTLDSNNADLLPTGTTAGNGITTTLGYDPNTGLPTSVLAGPSNTVAQFDYQYDLLGNLTYRDDVQQHVYEKYCYDVLNRLQNAATEATAPAACTATGTGITSKTMAYDALGNITSKSDVGAYTYPATGSPQPHGVSSITGTVNGVVDPSYSYDANGNLLTGAGRTMTYTPFNMAASIAQGSAIDCLTYDTDHMRVTMDVRPSSCSTGTSSIVTVYLNDPVSGAMSEKLVVSPTTSWRDYVVASGALVAVRSCTGAAPCSAGAAWSYITTDHLGSASILTNAAATVTERDSYDAWGRRRNTNGTDNAVCSITSAIDRGFTGHEMLDSLCQVNANARIYDPTLGRFMSPDGTTQGSDSQAYNRYSYVENRPLSATDPTGRLSQDCPSKYCAPTDGGDNGNGGGDGGIESVVVTGERIPNDPPPEPNLGDNINDIIPTPLPDIDGPAGVVGVITPMPKPKPKPKPKPVKIPQNDDGRPCYSALLQLGNAARAQAHATNVISTAVGAWGISAMGLGVPAIPATEFTSEVPGGTAAGAALAGYGWASVLDQLGATMQTAATGDSSPATNAASDYIRDTQIAEGLGILDVALDVYRGAEDAAAPAPEPMSCPH